MGNNGALPTRALPRNDPRLSVSQAPTNLADFWCFGENATRLGTSCKQSEDGVMSMMSIVREKEKKGRRKGGHRKKYEVKRKRLVRAGVTGVTGGAGNAGTYPLL